MTSSKRHISFLDIMAAMARAARLAALLVFPAILFAPSCSAAEDAPDVKVEFFGAERGCAAGSSPVTMLCVLRNVGRVPLQPNTLRVRCYALAGLDYTDGELAPAVPALAAGQAASFRWRLQPTDASATLVASALLLPSQPALQQKSGVSPVVAAPTDPRSVMPRAFIATIPHIASPAAAGAAPVGSAEPSAAYSGNIAKLSNDKVCIRFASAAGRIPVARLGARTSDGWVATAAISSLFSVNSASEGQSPWQRPFRWSASDSRVDPDSASLVLIGNCGEDWEAQVTLDCRKDSRAINGRIRLKARRNARLFSVQLPRLTAQTKGGKLPPANGSAHLITSSLERPESNTIAAVHRGMATTGISWSSRPPFADWTAVPIPAGDADHSVQLGVHWDGTERGEVFLPGGIVEFSFRLFAASPSDTLKDAEKFPVMSAGR